MSDKLATLEQRSSTLRTETLTECPLCGHSGSKLWLMGTDRLLNVSAHRFPYVRCTRCSLIFLSDRPTADSIGMFYPDEYHPYSEPATSAGNAARSVSLPERFLRIIETTWFERLRAKLMRRAEENMPDAFVPAMREFYKPPERGALLLDFGCGSPWFLSHQRTIRWSTIGMDFMEPIVDQLRKEGHRGILVSESGWAEIEDASLDAVRMNHVIEHLYDPVNVLSRILEKLKPGGRIHVSTPNPLGVSARVFRSRWFSLEAPRHLMFYSPEKLASLLSAQGYTDIRIVYERTPKDFARSLGFVLRDLKLMKPGLVLGMADEPLLSSWLAPFLWRLGAKGYGDRIHAFAVKPK